MQLLIPYPDEEVPVHVVLRTKLLDEDELEAYLSRIAISLEARAYGALHTRPGDAHDKPVAANELLYTGTIDQDQEPIICATELQTEGKDKPTHFVYIFWKLIVPICTSTLGLMLNLQVRLTDTI
jgi:hypothetical protein